MLAGIALVLYYRHVGHAEVQEFQVWREMTNAELNILVRVRAAEAQRQIAQLQTRLALMETQSRRAGAASNIPWFASMSAAGSRLQWIGRQITANLSGPIILATGLLVKSAMDQEKAMARLTKLYGDSSMSSEQLQNETNALSRAFTALSNKFGVNRAEVTNIAADWAAAGSSGVALAKSVELTMRTMVIGEMDAAEATQALIAIQAQYGEDTQGLTDTIYQLNAAENVSGTTLKGLVTGFAKAAGVARSAGVDTQHLAAMVAALTPAAGSASEAGNALKTIISRLMSPTGEAADVLNAMGIQLDSTSWKSLTATQRMELMATKFGDLSEAQKPVVSALVASRWQINKFEVAMRELASTNGYYQKVLDATRDKNEVFRVAQKELTTVLSTSSSKVSQAGNTIKNSLTDIVIPLLPAIAGMAQMIAKLTLAFQNLDPSVQKAVGIAILLLGVLGPLLTMMGLAKLAIGQLAPMFIFLARMMLLPLAPIRLLGAALLLPFTGTARLMAMLLASRAVFGGASVAALLFRGSLLAVAATQAILIAAVKVGAAAISLYPAAMAAARTAMVGIWVALGPVLFAIDAARIAAGLALQRAGAAAYIAVVTAWHAAIAALTIAWNYAMITLSAGYWAIYTSLQQTWWRLQVVMTSAYQMTISALHTAWNAVRLGLTRAFWAAYSALTVAGFAAARAATAIGGALLAAAHAAWQMLTLANLKRWAIAFITLTSGALTGALMVVKRFVVLIARFLVSPWALAIAAIVGILVYFKDQIARAIGNVIEYFKNLPQGIKDGLAPITNIFGAIGRAITNAFNALPESVKNVLLRLVAIVRAAALKIYELFSYINPFAHHSPSLVENVTNGMAAVGAQFGLAERNIGQHAAGIYDSITKMGNAAKSLKDANEGADMASALERISQTAPEAAGAYQELSDRVKELKTDLEAINTAIDQQQKVVDGLDKAVKAADANIDAMNDTLDAMKAAADAVGTALDAAKERLDYFSNAQIEGMQAASDATFENEMAQKRLQLQIAQLEKSAGTIDDVTDSYAKLQGQIETLQGKKLELQFAGAGSDITGPYDAMIASLKEQQNALADGASGPAAEMEGLKKQLQDLQDQASMMDLENSLKFDPLNRQLEKMKSNIVELPFDQIVRGYTQSSAAVDTLTSSQESLNMIISAQEAAIKTAESARDSLSARYDAENDKLSTLKDSYDGVKDAISDGEQALNDMTAAADASIQRMEDARQTMLSAIRLGLDPGADKAAVKAAQDAQDLEDAYKSLEEKQKGKKGNEPSPGLQNFMDAAGGEFADPGSNFTVGREGGLGDQTAQIDEFTKQTMAELANSWGGLDPFKPLKDGWNKTWQWIKDNFGSTVGPLKTMFSDIGKGVTEGFSAHDGELTRFQQLVENIRGAFENTWNFLKMLGGVLGNLFGPDLQATVQAVKDGLSDMWATIGPKLADLGKNLQPLWDLIKLIGAILIPVILGIAEVVWEVLNGAIRPVFAFIGDIIGAVIDIIKGLIRIIGGIAQVIIGVFTLDPDKIMEGLGNIVGGVVDIIKGLWDAIFSLFKNGGILVWNVVYGFIKGVIDFFVNLWDVLVGHSIVPDLINSIIDWFMGLPGKVIGFVADLVTSIINWFMDLPGKIWDALGSLGDKINGAFVDAMVWLLSKAPDWIQDLLNFFGGIPGKITGLLGDGLGMLVDFGKNIIQGLLNGAGTLLKDIGKFFLEKVPGWIKEPFKKALGIESPSKVFAEYGAFTGEGFIQGLDSQASAVQTAAQAMADSASNVTVPDLPALTAAPADPTADAPAAASTVADAMAATTAAASATWDAFAASMDASTQAWAAAQGATFDAMSAQVTTSYSAMYETMTQQTVDSTAAIESIVTAFNSQTVLSFQNLNQSVITSVTEMSQTMVTQFTTMKDQVVAQMTATKDGTTSAFQTMSDTLKSTFDTGIKPIFDSFAPMLKTMEDNFTQTVTNVGTIWDGMKEKTAAPARFMINDVYNNGVRVAWSKVSGWLGLKELDQFVAPFAAGGPLVNVQDLKNPNNPINIKAGGRLRAGATDDTLFAGKGGEFVLNNTMVKQAGGLGALERWRQASLRGGSVEGALSHAVMGYADGGTIPGKVLEGQDFARKTFTGQKYVYGGVGPNGFDCSGAQSVMWNFLTGQNPLFARAFDTEVDFSRYGFKPGLNGAYTIGVHNGGGGALSHMAGTLGGINLESGGAHNSSIFGGPAAGSDNPQFEKQYTLEEIGGKFSSGGMGGAMTSIREQVEKAFKETMDPIKGTWQQASGLMGDFNPSSYQKYYDEVSKFLYAKADEKDAERLRSNIGNIGGGVERWRSTVQDVLKAQGRPLSLDDITLAQMQTESGGNPSALNDWDDNWKAGHPSKGLMQVTDPTFQDYHDSHYPYDIWDPHANIAAGLNQVFSRYGGPQGVWAQGHGYDNGGYLQPGIIGNFSGADEPVLTHDQWGTMYGIAQGAQGFSWQTVQRGVVAANQVLYGAQPSETQAEATATALQKVNDTWVPDFYDASQAQVEAADSTAKSAAATTTATKGTVKALDNFTKVGGQIKSAVDDFSKLMLAISTAMSSDKQNFSTWAPVITAAADLIEKLPDVKATYVPWAGTNQTVTEEMKRQKQANDIANLAKGGYMFFKQVAPALLRATATIGTAVEKLIEQDASAWAQGISLLSMGNPMGALILIPIILKEIFTILPLVIQAIMDIVPALIQAIIMFITQFMPDSVYAYDTYDSANQAVQDNEGAIRQGASAPYFVPPAQNTQNQNPTTNVYVYEVNVTADSPDSADQFVTNLQTLG